jgi:hypothetical protein
VASFGQIHGEVHMTTEGSESHMVKSPDGVYVTGHRADGQILVASGHGLGDDAIDQLRSDSAPSKRGGNHYGLDLPAGPPVEETSEANDGSLGLGDPASHSFRKGQVRVESRSRIVASDRTVLVDPTMMGGKFSPQLSAGRVVAGGVPAYQDVELGHVHKTTLPYG